MINEPGHQPPRASAENANSVPPNLVVTRTCSFQKSLPLKSRPIAGYGQKSASKNVRNGIGVFGTKPDGRSGVVFLRWRFRLQGTVGRRLPATWTDGVCGIRQWKVWRGVPSLALQAARNGRPPFTGDLN